MSRPKRNTATVTFQPEPDVAALLGEWRHLGRGELTRRINQAIRSKHHEAALRVAEREAAEAAARLKWLRGLTSLD